MCDAAVSIIQQYIHENLFSPALSWDKFEFKKRSYELWAAYELIERIMDKPLEPPIFIIEDFFFEMGMYTYYGKDERSSIFQVAAETAEELLLLFV